MSDEVVTGEIVEKGTFTEEDVDELDFGPEEGEQHYLRPDMEEEEEEEGKEEEDQDGDESTDEDELTVDAIKEMELSDLIKLANEEGIDTPEGMTKSQLQSIVIRELSGDANDEDIIINSLDPKAQQLFRSQKEQLQSLSQKASFVDSIEQDPEGAIKRIAEHFKIDIGKGVGKSEDTLAEAFEVNMPEIEEDESAQSYIKRTLDMNLKEYGKHILAQQTKPKEKSDKPEDSIGSINQAINDGVQYLANKYSDWRVYQDTMKDMITQDPTLIYKPDELYNRARGQQRSAAKIKRLSRRRETTVKSGERAKIPAKTGLKPKSRAVSFDEAFDLSLKQAKN